MSCPVCHQTQSRGCSLVVERREFESPDPPIWEMYNPQRMLTQPEMIVTIVQSGNPMFDSGRPPMFFLDHRGFRFNGGHRPRPWVTQLLRATSKVSKNVVNHVIELSSKLSNLGRFHLGTHGRFAIDLWASGSFQTYLWTFSIHFSIYPLSI